MSTEDLLITRIAAISERDRSGEETLSTCRSIRKAVFIDEQGISSDLEWDGLDAACEHFVAYSSQPSSASAIGTARLRIETGHAKAQRVAVLASARGKGVGRRLMEAVEARAKALGVREMELHAQTTVVEFYLELGYKTEGATFREAGIEHLAMRKRLA